MDINASMGNQKPSRTNKQGKENKKNKGTKMTYTTLHINTMIEQYEPP